jgi:uncharacterized protein YjbI with pentapeptide repeats
MHFREIFLGQPNRGPIDDPTPLGYLALATAGREVWNAWRAAYPVQINPVTGNRKGVVTWVRSPSVDFDNRPVPDFRGFNFGDEADFNGRTFNREVGPVRFDGAIFGARTCFDSAVFLDGASFAGAVFGDDTSFMRARFVRSKVPGTRPTPWVDFEGAKFGHRARLHLVPEWPASGTVTQTINFDRVEVGDDARISFTEGLTVDIHFQSASFGKAVGFGIGFRAASAHFPHAVFGDKASFSEVNFQRADFTSAKFLGDSFFKRGETGVITFRGVTFAGSADFSNRQFNARTIFSDARFQRAPLFHNAKLHQDTEFDDESFPASAEGTGEASRAYRTLKLAMSETQAGREELFFFRQEMREDRAILWRSKSVLKKLRAGLFGAYGLLSDYGLSVGRPSVALLLLWLGGAAAFAAFSTSAAPWMPGRAFDAAQTVQWLTFSAVNSLPLGGMDETSKNLYPILFGRHPVIISQWLGSLMVLQKILALLFLFLIGLALRNHFKMK